MSPIHAGVQVEPAGRKNLRGAVSKFLDNKSYINNFVRILLAVMMAAMYLIAYRRHPNHPHIGGFLGWWGAVGSDQDFYYKAAVAWANGDLRPSEHWFLPGYPLIAAPLVKGMSVHAYLIPNLVCLLLSMWLFSRIVEFLAPHFRYASAIGAFIFALVTTVSPMGLDIWVMPWSTSGATPFVYACLLATLNSIRAPKHRGYAFIAGLTGGLVAAFRPADAAPLLLACGICIGLTLLRQRFSLRGSLTVVLSAALGVGLALSIIALTYLPTHGLHASAYIEGSNRLGFDWRLIPLHWVIIVLDPQPLIHEGKGLIQEFPWMIVGIAGLCVYLVLPFGRGNRTAHTLVILAIILYFTMYMSYRALQPVGLFRYFNYHYFKWIYPFLALYAVLLCYDLIFGRRRRIMCAIMSSVFVLLLPWRVELRRNGAISMAGDKGPHQFRFESGLTSIRDAILVPGSGDWGSIYFGPHSLKIGSSFYSNFGDFDLFARSGGFILIPVRPLAAGSAELTVHPNVAVDDSVEAIKVRQDTVFGIPCYLPRVIHECPKNYLLPATMIPADGRLVFDGKEEPYLDGDWADSEKRGRWTDGHDATVRLRVPSAAGDFQITIDGTAFAPPPASPVSVSLIVNGSTLLTQNLGNGEALKPSITIPHRLIISDENPNTLEITLHILNPRRPEDYDPRYRDPRMLGVFVKAIELSPK